MILDSGFTFFGPPCSRSSIIDRVVYYNVTKWPSDGLCVLYVNIFSQLDANDTELLVGYCH